MAIEWKRPNPKGQYMRGSVVDLLPDPVSPLFATLAIPAVARVGIKQVLRPLTRSEPDLPADYIVTINDYLYMGVAFTPHQWWWIVSRMMLSFPRMLREALPLWRDKIRPHYAATVAAWQGKPLEAMSAAELWAAIQEVDDAAMLHLASLLVATTGASAGSEMLFTRVYEKLIRREGDPAAADLPDGLRQHAHPRREVALRPGDVVPGAGRPGRLSAGDAGRAACSWHHRTRGFSRSLWAAGATG